MMNDTQRHPSLPTGGEGPGVRLRTATEADLPQLLDIYNDVILNTTAVYSYDPHNLQMRQEWFAQKQQAGHPVFVAEEENTIVGFSSYGPFRAWQAYQFTVENSVYVKKDCRGKGIAKLLMQPLIDSAKNAGLHTIVAGIDATNEASIRLHQQFGFKQVAYFKEVGYKFNRWLDLVFMQLMLK
jgi:L-amino acid N-acyltransferase